jgi:hypothetical protein
MVREVSEQGVYKFAARVLYDLGFNVVLVDSNKKPVSSWSSDKRLVWEELERYLSKASGIAVTGKYLEDNDYGVVVLDLDDVDVAGEVLAKVFGEEWLARLCGQTWSFCGFTGPRPKGRVVCDCKAPGEDCDCVIQDTGERKRLSELRRGMYIIVRVPKNCMPSGSIRSDAVEIMVTNYEVVYGRHPSGVYYQPVKWEDGRWKPIGIEDVGQGEVITCDELKALIALIKQSTTNALEELGKEDAKTAVELNLPEPTKELSEDAINKIISLVRSLWWLESDEGKHYHDKLLFGLSSLMRRAGIKYEIARKVVEGIINTGVQDIAGKVDPNALQAIMRNEERHFRETVDHVYNKPTARLWGRKSFEEALRPAIEKAIGQGLLSVAKPEEWFKAVYKLLGLKKRVSQLARLIAKRLPRTSIDVHKLPKWIWDFELRLDKCEDWYFDTIFDEAGFVVGREVKCTRRVRSVTREDSQYVLIVEVTYKREAEYVGKDHDRDVYRYHHKRIYTHIATLPRFMGIVYDPFYAERYYVAFKDGKLHTAAPISEFESFLADLRKAPFSMPRNKQYLDLINEALNEVRMVISPGLADDVFIDPYGVLDVNDYGVEPLVNAYTWVRKYYPEANAKWAWFNVMAAVAKLITPMVRYYNPTFNDLIVYNVGRGGEGKSTLVRYVLIKMYGGDIARDRYYVVIDGSVRTEPQLRNLLSLNRLPLILDEQDKKAFSANVGVFLSAVVGMGTTGVQAARYGHGIAVKFKNLRGLIVFTNVQFTTFLRNVMSEASDFAIIRRFVEVPWDSEPIDINAFSDLPDIKPVYGFMASLWGKYRGEFVKSADLLDLVEKLALALAREYPGDARVDELVKYTIEVVRELREARRRVRLLLTDADVLLDRAYEFVASELKTSPSSAVKVLRYILENQQRAGVRLTKPRRREDLDRLKTDLDIVMHKYVMYRYGIEDTSDRGIVGKDNDAVALYTLLRDAYENDNVLVVLYARSPLVPGTPRVFLGAEKSTYADMPGYAIPLAKLVRIFLAGESEESENEESGETTEEPSSNGEVP